MDDSFAFRTTVPLRRQVDPRLVRAGISGTLVVLGIGLFASWIVASERASFAPTHDRVRSDVTIAGVDGAADPFSTDADAVKTTRMALIAARAAFTEHRSFLDAGTAQLSALRPGYTFVDGPSTTPGIVSVASTADTWAAAVQDPGGTCHWIRTTSAGATSRSTGSECTGAAALTPPAPR
jgi:hypothetical protein